MNILLPLACCTIQIVIADSYQERRRKMANFVRPPCDEEVIRSTTNTLPVVRNMGIWVLIATILGSSMAFIDGTVVNVALPILQRDLNATSADVQWVVEAYSLFLAA